MQNLTVEIKLYYSILEVETEEGGCTMRVSYVSENLLKVIAEFVRRNESLEGSKDNPYNTERFITVHEAGGIF